MPQLSWSIWARKHREAFIFELFQLVTHMKHLHWLRPSCLPEHYLLLFSLQTKILCWSFEITSNVVQQCAKLAKQSCTHMLCFTVFSCQNRSYTVYKHRLPCHWFTAMRGYELWPWASIYTLPYPLFHLRNSVAYLQTILSFRSDIFIKMLYFLSQVFTSFHNRVSGGKSSAHGIMQLHKI